MVPELVPEKFGSKKKYRNQYRKIIRVPSHSGGGVGDGLVGGLLGGGEILPSKEGDQEVNIDCNRDQLCVDQGDVHPPIQQQLSEKKKMVTQNLKYIFLRGSGDPPPVFDGKIFKAFFQLGKSKVRREEALCGNLNV